MKRKDKTIFIAALFVYGCLGVWMSFMSDIHTDENWWYYWSTMVAKGQLPHFDFFCHHNPLFYYIYAIPQWLLGPSMVVGRLVSVFFALLSFGILLRLSYKKGGSTALVISCLFYLVNLFSIYNYSMFHYQALQTFFFTLFMSVFFGESSRNYKTFWLSLLFVVLIGTRYNTDYFAIIAAIVFFYHLIKVRKDPKPFFIMTGIWLVGFSIIYVPHLLLIPEKYLFNTVWYLLTMDSFKASFGVADYSLMDSLIYRLSWIKEFSINFFPELVVISAMVFASLINRVRSKNKHDHYKFLDSRFSLAILFIAISFLFYIIPHSSGLSYPLNLTFPLMVLISSVGFVKMLESVKENAIYLKILLVSIILFSFCLQIPVGNQNLFSYTVSRSDIHNVKTVAEKIKKYTKPNDSILTFSPIFAAEADRQILHGMEMEYGSFFPTWDSDLVRKYDLMNVDLLKQSIANKSVGAVVLTEIRFFENRGLAQLIAPYREEVVQLIENNYELVEKIDVPHSIFRGDIYIYLPKSS